MVEARAWTHRGRLACVAFLRGEDPDAGRVARILARLGHLAYFYSAPASPTRGGPKDFGAAAVLLDFDFSSPSPSAAAMSSADELFCNGQIRHIRLAAALLQPPQPHGDAAAAPGTRRARPRPGRSVRRKAGRALQPGEADAVLAGGRRAADAVLGGWRRRGGRGSGRRCSRARPTLKSLAIASADEDRNDAAPSPRGLDPAVLAAIPVVAVAEGPGAVTSGDCAVCLAELEPGEKTRELPRCGHRFHVECIDAWFRGDATCPLCRADAVVVNAAPSAPAKDGAPPEVRIDVAGDAAGHRSVAPPKMARLASGTDLGKARQVFASARFAASF